MSRQVIQIGTTDNDHQGEPIRSAFNKCNGNFAELYDTTSGILETVWAGTQAANQAYALAQIGTNDASAAKQDAYQALQTAWSGTSGANAAMTVAVAGTNGVATAIAIGTNAAQQARNVANVALSTAWTGTQTANAALQMAQNGTNCGFSFVIDGGGAAVTTGLKGYVEVPFSMWIKRWTIFADQSGSAVVDVLKSNGYAGFPTVPSIAASAKPTLSNVQKNQDTTLTGWNKQINAGDIIGFNVNSASVCTIVTVALAGTRTA